MVTTNEGARLITHPSQLLLVTDEAEEEAEAEEYRNELSAKQDNELRHFWAVFLSDSI